MLTLTELAKQVGETLQKKGFSITTAESCTGGEVSQVLTSTPKSSTWFDCGFITYSNEAKQELLNVPAEMIKQYGAVSEQTARAMAEGALKNSRAQVSIAITGIAGPDGGSDEKPVGTVWIAWSFKDKATQAKLYNFSGDRVAIRHEATIKALEDLMRFL